MNQFLKPFGRLVLMAFAPALILSGCGNNDDDGPAPVPEIGRIQAYHAAANANVGVKVLVDDAEVAQLTYGQNSGYKDVTTGSRTIKVNVASSNQNVITQAATVEKDKYYSLFAYASSNSTTSTSVAGLLVTDDLSAPATAGNAKIRVVHLAFGAPSPVKLSQSTVAGQVDVPNTSTAFPTASAFVEIPAGSYNLSVTTGTPSVVVVAVGDGSGTGTGTKNYDAGKIYTVLVRGIAGSLDSNLQPKAVVIQHN